MLQIIDLENNQLFAQVSAEESATVSGNGVQSAGLAGLITVGTGIFGNPLIQAGLLFIALNPNLA